MRMTLQNQNSSVWSLHTMCLMLLLSVRHRTGVVPLLSLILTPHTQDLTNPEAPHNDWSVFVFTVSDQGRCLVWRNSGLSVNDTTRLSRKNVKPTSAQTENNGSETTERRGNFRAGAMRKSQSQSRTCDSCIAYICIRAAFHVP